MTTVMIQSDDPTKIDKALEQLASIEGITIEIIKDEKLSQHKSDSVLSLAGIWKNRNINNNQFRDEAWEKEK